MSPPRRATIGWGTIGRGGLFEGQVLAAHLGSDWLRRRRLDRHGDIQVEPDGSFVLRVPLFATPFLVAQADGYVPALAEVTAGQGHSPMEIVLRKAPVLALHLTDTEGSPIRMATVQVYSAESTAAVSDELVARYRLLGLGGGASRSATGHVRLQQRQQVATDDAGRALISLRVGGEITLACWPSGFGMTVLKLGHVSEDRTVNIVARPLREQDRMRFRSGGEAMAGWHITVTDITDYPQIAFEWTLSDDGSMPAALFRDGHKYLLLASAPATHSEGASVVTRGLVHDGRRDFELGTMLTHEELIR